MIEPGTPVLPDRDTALKFQNRHFRELQLWGCRMIRRIVAVLLLRFQRETGPRLHLGVTWGKSTCHVVIYSLTIDLGAMMKFLVVGMVLGIYRGYFLVEYRK